MTALCLEPWKCMRLIPIKCSVRSKGKAFLSYDTGHGGLCVYLYLGVNEWVTLYSGCRHWLLTAKLAFVNCQRNKNLLMGKGGWKHTVLRGNSSFIVPLHLPEGTRDLGLPVSSHTHWLRGG